MGKRRTVIFLVDSKRLHGKKIVGSKGYRIGEVEQVDIELSSWQVTSLQVGLTKEAAIMAGFKRPFLSHQIVVQIPIELVKGVGDVITLRDEAENLKALVDYLGWR